MNLRVATLLFALAAGPTTELHASAGTLSPIGDGWLRVTGDVRAEAKAAARAARVRFVFRGPSASLTPLASGEIRQQVGLKLRAQDTCNVVYVMWHLAPASGVFVSVKRNAGKTTHAQCGAGGYTNLRAERGASPPPPAAGEEHTLSAEVERTRLRVWTDGHLAWEAQLPAEAFAFDGPPGIRTDNADVDIDFSAH